MNFYTYKAFGLLIHSEYRFTTLSPITSDNNSPDVYVKFLDKSIHFPSTALFVKRNIVLYSDGFHFTVGNIEIFYVHNEKSIYLKKTDEETLEAYLLGPMMALLGAYRRHLPLHAAGLLLNNRSILIAGRSGAGKSTLLVELIQKHAAQYFSDDMVWIQQNNNLLQAKPSFPAIKLWDDAAERLHAQKEKAIHHKIHKYYIDLKSQYIETLQIPEIIIVLKTSSLPEFKIEEIIGSKKFLLLQSYIYRKPWIEPMFKHLVFSTLTELCNLTRVLLLTRPLLISPKAWDNALSELLERLEA